MQEYENIRRREFINEFSYKLKLKNSIRKYNYYLGLAGISMILLLVFHSCGKEEGESEPKLLSKPGRIAAYVQEKSVIITWDAVKNADGYNIKRYRESVDQEYLSIGSVSSTSFVDYNPANGKNCYYVYSFNKESGQYDEPASVVCEYDDNGGGGGDDTGTLPAPSGLNAAQEGTQIYVTWKPVAGASGYKVYRSSSASGSYSSIGMVTSPYKYDSSPLSGYNYYKVTAVNREGGESSMSSSVSCNYTSGGGSTITKPDVPTGVRVANEGSVLIPMITIRWNSVANATSYKVYRSTAASGSYLQIGSATTNTVLTDDRPREGTTYYKVKAINSAGESDYSAYASIDYKANDVAPCPVTYGNCTVSGATMTLRWTVPQKSGCGVPTKAYLRVKNPQSGQYADIQTLSGTATSASFSYGMWVDANGYVYVGIITENAKGTSGGIPKIYDNKNKRWMN